MDLGTVIGIVLSFGLVLSAILVGSSLAIFISVPSMLIVIGGTIGASLVNYPMGHVLGVIIDKFMDFANRARREGILSLEPALKSIEDDFLRKGLQLTVDGLEPQVIQEILETEIQYLENRHETGAEILKVFADFAPAMGMIGTVIGLVQMLQTMSDPSTIGPAMAVALLT
ncbi:MotA/TolQ/ExbB proton channel family protein, partial [Aduncisulcus paluster]